MIIGIDASRATAAERTGTEAYAAHLLQALLPQARAAGHRLILYCNQPPAAELRSLLAGAEWAIIPFPRLWTHLRLAWALQRRPPDVFYTPAHVIPLSYGHPSVATVHDLGYLHFPQAHTAWQRLYLRWSTAHNARRSRRVIADSQATREDLVRLAGIDRAKVAVVYPGPTPGLRRVEDAGMVTEVLARHQITPPYLLYLGTLQPRKNLVRLVEAYARLPEPRPQLVLAGRQGWQAGPILQAVARLGPSLAGQVRLPGYVPEADKAALISGALALLFPSLYEGFGFPVLEGQACGTPVLCANSSSLPEVAGEGALLVPAEEVAALCAGISRLLHEPALRARLVRAGYANLRRFSWEQAASQVLNLLLQAAAGGKP